MTRAWNIPYQVRYRNKNGEIITSTVYGNSISDASKLLKELHPLVTILSVKLRRGQ